MLEKLYKLSIGPLHDPVTWCEINCGGPIQVSKQGKVGLDWYKFLCFRSPTALFASQHTVIYYVPCDWIVQRALGYWFLKKLEKRLTVFTLQLEKLVNLFIKYLCHKKSALICLSSNCPCLHTCISNIFLHNIRKSFSALKNCYV